MPAPVQLLEALGAWEVGRVLGAEELKPGRVWRVTTDGGAFILKNWGAKDDGLEQRVAFYQGVMAHVAARGVAVERAVPDRAGRLIHRREKEAWWLVRTLPNDPGPLGDQEAEALQRDYGRAIAELHRALATYPEAEARRGTWRKAVRDEVLTHDLPTIRARLDPSARERFEAAVAPHEREFAQRLDGLPEQLIFYDCHHGNILRVGARVTGFVDADHLSIGMRIWDLAYLGAQGLLDVDQCGPAEWSRRALLVVDAYRSVNPLEEREFGAIWHVMLGFKLNMLAGVASGSTLDHLPKLLDQIERLHRVRPFFP
jgi:homoserine kinase type II